MVSLKKHWKKLLILGLGMLLLAAAGWFALFTLSGQEALYQLTSRSCSDPVFTLSPTVRSDFGYLIPLGNINPPDHTLPTDHIYYVFNRPSVDAPVPVFDVRFPGNVYLTRITYTSELQNGVLQNFDYKVEFSPCGPVDAYFDHIHVLSPKLAEIYGKTPTCDDHYPRPGTIYRYCSKDLHSKMNAGELVGQAGGAKAAGFDFGASDTRSPALAFVDPGRVGSPHAICPFDLYGAAEKATLEANFQHSGPGPICGEIMQDLPGTAQGDWFYGTGNNDPSDWQNDLALVHDNRDTTQMVLAIGGHIGQPTRLQFSPLSSGTTNRSFNQVRPGPTLYCYRQSNLGQGDSGQPRVIIQLVDTMHLKIEMQTGSCNEPYSFRQPTVYAR